MKVSHLKQGESGNIGSIEDLPEYLFTHRHWGAENNPKRAVRDFVAENPRFRIRSELNDKLLLTAAMDGYLECISD